MNYRLKLGRYSPEMSFTEIFAMLPLGKVIKRSVVSCYAHKSIVGEQCVAKIETSGETVRISQSLTGRTHHMWRSIRYPASLKPPESDDVMEEIIRRYGLTDEPHLVRKLKNNRRVAFFGCGVFHIYPRPAETVPCTTSNCHQIKIHIFPSGSKYGNGIAVSWVDVAAMEAIKAASEKVVRDRRKSLLKKLDL